MDETAQKTGLRYRTEFNTWIIQTFVTVMVFLMVSAVAYGLHETGSTVDAELSRHDPATNKAIPATNVPFHENGPNLALAEGGIR
ncbi:MAG: hypothetical protein QY323_04585 [Patescibacteria group bacterium]|nr:MAG: hypothetical protein QY323_04585 [Patescibacteria group bacterium]